MTLVDHDAPTLTAVPIRHARLDDWTEPRSAAPLVRELELRLASAIPDERRRTGRDLQAGVLQRLAATRMHLSTVMESSGTSDGRLADICRSVDLAAQELKATISTPAPAALARAGLGDALLASLSSGTMPVDLRDDLDRRHPMRVELAVFFCCREAIQNALKHSGAATVAVALGDRGDGVEFSVRDDGAGFDPARGHGGVGLMNMRERVTAAGGWVALSSVSGVGSTVRGFVPDLLPERPAADSDQPAQRDALLSLRRQIVLETDVERRRIMRDLHDGAQQRLTALRVKIGLAIELTPTSAAERPTLERTACEIDIAIAELRDLARGLLNTNDRAVAPALRDVTRHWPMHVRVRERSSSHPDRAAQAVVYGCVLEALQHARAQPERATTSSAIVSVVQDSAAIHFVVRGRGRAFELGGRAALASADHVSDRASAAGGSLSYEPLPGRGVVIRGSIPYSVGI